MTNPKLTADPDWYGGITPAADITAIKAVTDVIPDAGAMTSIGQEASITAAQADITAIKAVTDVIPDAGAMTSIAQEASITAAQADITAIKAVTDVIPDAGAMTSIAQETTVDAVQSTVDDIEQHHHNAERWWGALAAPDETNAIESNVDRPYAATSGANTWGAAIPVVGTADNAGITGLSTEFDMHEILITDLDDDTTPWKIRLIWGTGTSGDAITAEQCTERMVQTNAVPGNRAGGTPVPFKMIVLDVGTKMWAQSWNATGGEIMSFFLGAHGYPAPIKP